MARTMIFWGINVKNIFRPLILCALAFALVVMSAFLIYLRFARADLATLYPGSCLGSWQNPYLAQGRPDGDGTLADKENSAVFSEGGIKEIYCGNFNGDLSENEIKLIKNVNLKFSWLVSDASSADEELQVATSSVTIIQSPATSTEAVVQNTNDVINQILNNIHADEVSVIVSTTTLEIIITTNTTTSDVVVNATTSDVGIDTTENTAAIVSEIKEPQTATSSPTSFWWKKYNFFFADDEVSNVQQETPIFEPPPTPPYQGGEAGEVNSSSVSEIAIATSSLDSPLAPTEDFLKASYTLDGVNWLALGTVNKNNWQDASFQIPVYQLEDVKKIQIKIESLPLVNKTPFVYLDGLALQVEYDRDGKPALIYNRSPLGNNITSPVSFSVSFNNFSDLGCNPLVNWNYWGILVETSDLSKDYLSAVLADSATESFIFSVDLPADDYAYIMLTCHLENNRESFGSGRLLEGAFEGKTIFSIK